MTMQMHRAFNSRMLSRMTKYNVLAGSYDAENNWVEGQTVSSLILGVVKAGNKFSQFDEGISQRVEDGGTRLSDYLSIYMQNRFVLELTDKVEWNGKYFNVLQKSDEDQYGFTSYIAERSENWSPS